MGKTLCSSCYKHKYKCSTREIFPQNFLEIQIQYHEENHGRNISFIYDGLILIHVSLLGVSIKKHSQKIFLKL